MTDGQLLDRVRELRASGHSPKEIARSLGVAPAVVAPLVREIARARPRPGPGEAPPLVGCWVNPGWSQGLSVEGHPDWPGQDRDSLQRGGMVAVLVARQPRPGKVSACGYLVDTYCLGVKNVVGPLKLSDWELSGFVRHYFGAFDGDSVAAPLELARHLVFGAVDYARELGFEPHRDFPAAAGHLGTWSGRSAITFGQAGEPYYIEGPWDDSRRVMRTLERTVGAGHFHFLVELH
jgi:hypothetical protein